MSQSLMVATLSKSLPSDWTLVVKEHPSQFVSNYTRYGEQSRSKRFYENLIKYKNVQLANMSEDVFALIDNAQAVASVGGTICWEAIARGRPALNFAKTWFSGCEGVFFIDSTVSLDSALKKKVGEQWSNLRNAFRSIDHDASGRLGPAEMRMVLENF